MTRTGQFARALEAHTIAWGNPLAVVPIAVRVQPLNDHLWAIITKPDSETTDEERAYLAEAEALHGSENGNG